MTKGIQLNLILCFSLLLVSCGSGPLTDEPIVKKYFRQAGVGYDSQGKATGIICPKAIGTLEAVVRDLFQISIYCPVNGPLISK